MMINKNNRVYSEHIMASAVEAFKRSAQTSIRDSKLEILIGKSNISDLVKNSLLKIKNKYDTNNNS